MAFLLLIFILVIRLIFLVNWDGFLDSDESVHGVMGKHISEGREWPVFTYGQNYKGALEPYTLAFFFKIFGFQTFLIKIVPFFYFILSLLFLWLIYKKFLRRNGNILLVFFLFPPLSSMIIFLKLGYAVEMVFLCVLFLYLLFLYQKKQNLRIFYWLCFLSGFTIFIHALSLPFLLLCLILNFFNDKKLGYKENIKLKLKKYVFGLWFFIIGLAPRIIHGIQNSSADLGVNMNLLDANIWERAVNVFSIVIPVSLGGFIFGDKHGNKNELSIFFSAEAGLFFLNILALAFLFFYYKKDIIKFVLFKKRPIPKQLYFLLSFPVYIFVFIFSQYPEFTARTVKYGSFFSPSDRYFILLLFFLPIILSETYFFIKKINVKLAAIFIISSVASGLIISSQLFFSFNNYHKTTLNFQNYMHNKNYERVIDFLDKNDFIYGFADFCEQMNINYLSKEKIQLAAFDYYPDPKITQNRYQPYWDNALANIDNAVFIFYKNIFIYIPKYYDDVEFPDNEYQVKIIDDFYVYYPAHINLKYDPIY